DASKIHTIEYFGGKLIETEIPLDIEGLTVSIDAHKNTYRQSSAPSTQLPSLEAWLSLLAGSRKSWRYALLQSDVIVQGQKYQTNPMKQIFAPTRGLFVEILNPNDPAKTELRVKEQPRHNRYVEVIE